MKLYFFNTPARVGGAGTKFHHLLRLLTPHYEITITANSPGMMPGAEWQAELDSLGVQCRLWSDLPGRLDGWAVGLCNHRFFEDGLALDARRRGLRIAWSNEMMWLFPGEAATLMLGGVDCVMYVSPVQREVLEPRYAAALGTVCGEVRDTEAVEGVLAGPVPLRWVMTGNWIDPALFPWPAAARSRSTGESIVIGRMSRPDPDKFPDDFPQSYEGLGLRGMRARVMGWDAPLTERWPGFSFGPQWELLPPDAETAADFLASLDLFVYGLGPVFRESWGRAVAEAMLCGAVPLVPGDPRHHLCRIVPHGVGGVHCFHAGEWGEWARELQRNDSLRRRLARGARDYAVEVLCRREHHLALWARVFCP